MTHIVSVSARPIKQANFLFVRSGLFALWALTLLTHSAVFAQTTNNENRSASDTKIVEPLFIGLASMPGERNYVQTRLGRIHYWTLGKTGDPAIFLLHQGPWFSIQFSKVMPIFAGAGYRVVAVDIPGFGLSERPVSSPTGTEYADALRELQDALSIKKTAVVGILTGGTISLAFAAQHPDRVSCTVLQSTPVYSKAELKSRLEASPPDTRIYQDGRHIMSWWSNIKNRRGLENASPESLQWLMIGTMLAGDESYSGERSKSFVTRTFDAASALKLIRAPTLIISVGDANSENWARVSLDLRKDFSHVTIAKQGDLLPYDRAQEWASPVLEFMSSHCR